jgi:hypothetical protein
MPNLAHAWRTQVDPLMDMYQTLVMNKYPFANLLTLTCFIIMGGINCKIALGSKRLYWLHSMVLSVLGSFFGGTIVMICLGATPPIFTNDLMIPIAIAVWYALHQLDLLDFLMFPPITLIWTTLSTCFRVHGTIRIVNLAAEKIPASSYPGIAIVAPIVLGTVNGCGGMFFPLQKGLAPLEKGCPWPVQLPFFVAAVYHILINDREGPLGSFARDVIGDHCPYRVTLALVTFGLINNLTQAFFDASANLLTPFHKLLYLVFQVQGPELSEKYKRKGLFDTVGWAYDTRLSLERWLEFLRILFVIAVVVLHIVNSMPPSTLGTNKPVFVGRSGVLKVVGVCQVAPKLSGCSPFFLQLSEKTPGKWDLGVFQQQTGLGVIAQSEHRVWNTAFAVRGEGSKSLVLGEDGVLRLVASENQMETVLWQSKRACKAAAAGKSTTLELEASDGTPFVRCADGSTTRFK